MLKKRIIPCLDIMNGRTVKGINFNGLKDAGDPVELAKKYADVGADELVFLDITATNEKRKTLIELVEKVAAQINIPFTVGGGINSLKDVKQLIEAGADKISVNSAAVFRPELLAEIAAEFGSQCLVLAIDIKELSNCWKVFTNGGRNETLLIAEEWAVKGVQLGAGEILLTSMDHDGTKQGFAIEIIRRICNLVKVPLIASGGAGNEMHFEELFLKTPATGALAASIFHFGEVDIPTLKANLKNNNILIR